MLPERVVREENLLFRHIGDGGFRPVDHGNVDERQGAFAQTQTVARIKNLEFPVGDVEKARQRVFAFRVADDRRVGARLDHCRKRARMVELRVKTDEIVDLFEIDERRDVPFKLSGERRFDRVDKRGFLVANQIRVVRRAEARVVTVEIANVIVYVSDVVDAGSEFSRQFHSISFLFLTVVKRGRERRPNAFRTYVIRAGISPVSRSCAV